MVRNTGVIGAGVMGSGVAQTLAYYGMNVVLIDRSNDALNRARKEIHNNLRMSPLLYPGLEPKDPDEVVSRINFTLDFKALSNSDFIVENVTEKWDIKKPVYETIDPIAPDHCVFAVNTSAISITKVGGITSRPDRVVGMHFMNPVPMKPLVEVIRGYHTSESTLAIAKDFLRSMGKKCVVVQDMPGFVSNRVLMLTVNEAAFLVQDQVSVPADIDRIFKSCFGHKMGPLETIDLIGVDTILFSLEVLYESYNDPKFRPCPLLRKMVDAGLLGRKSGQGFYPYPTLNV